PEQKGTHDERPSRDPATYHRTPSPIRSVLWTHLEWNRVCRDRYRGELWNDPIRDRIDYCGTHRRDLRDVRHRTGIRSALSGVDPDHRGLYLPGPDEKDSVHPSLGETEGERNLGASRRCRSIAGHRR